VEMTANVITSYSKFQFQGNQIIILCFIATLHVDEKKKRKLKKLSQLSKVHISETAGAI